jgi:hypothetical protein
MHVKCIPEDKRTEDLTGPVECIIQCPRPDVELGQIYVIELVRIGPIAGEEHGKEQDDICIKA